jgi:hypothetical protein|tara:strand:+ start:1481 stop:4408 length:2928 start_codon:yes stop_codon:yes gene_type:complete
MPRSAQLFSYTDPRELWLESLPEWFETNASLRPPGSGPVIVLAPEVTRLGWLKKTWLEQGGRPLLGVEFWTPGKLRRYLLDRLALNTQLATAEDLALMVRLVLKDEPTDAPLGVIAQNPNSFLYAWDTWMAARADPSLFARPWRDLPRRLEKALKRIDLQSVRAVDAELASFAEPSTPLLGPILIDGFSAVHSSLFPLLTAAMRQSESSLCTLPFPRERRMELVWNGTFESVMETMAELAPPVPDMDRPFATWAERAESGIVAEERPEKTHFRLFETRTDEITALAQRIEVLFAQSGEGTIAVALPSDPYLIRRLTAQLIESGIPIHDSFGFFPTGTDAEHLFAAWVAFQRTGQLIEADSFIDALVNSGDLSALEAKRTRRAWTTARERTLSDELSVLSAYLRLEGDQLPGQPSAVEWANTWSRLPDNATIALYLEISAPAFAQWDNALNFEEARSGWDKTWEHFEEKIDRSRFLEWLWESLRRPGRARDQSARDAFAPVQIISYDMLGSAAWSQLLLAGLNERLVPAPSRETAFLLPDAAHRHLSKNIVEGSQGEGHEVLRPESGFLLEDRDRRALLSGALFDAIAATSDRVELFATYAPEGTDRTATVLSEYYQRLYRAAMGRAAAFPTTGKAVRNEQKEEGSVSTIPLRNTGEAYAHRFDPETPFDEYSFSYDKAPPEPLTLGARQWEALLKRPATVWLESIAHLRPREDYSEPVQLPLLRGSAVHRLLRRPSAQKWYPLTDSGTSWLDSVREQALRWQRFVEQAHEHAGLQLSPLWREQWGWAQQQALVLANLVATEARDLFLATEYSLPDGGQWTSAAGDAISIRGRIDALLVDNPDNPSTATVIDFKTGGDSALKTNKLGQGDGLQLLLYGGALTDLWQCEVGLTIVKPGDASVAAQIFLSGGEDPSEALSDLSTIGRNGRIGFAGQVRSAYAYVGEYPIAFVAPPSEILVEKWRHTHIGLKLPKGTES